MIVIGGGRLFTLCESMPYFENGAVAADGGRIIETGSAAEIKSKYPDAEFISAEGGIIMPGLINAHTHLHKALARGAVAAFPCADEAAVCNTDGRLTLSECIDSAYAAYTECIMNGVTAVIDMQCGADDPRGVLFAVCGAACDIGIRAALGYGVSGGDKSASIINENVEFASYCGKQRPELTAPIFCMDKLYSLGADELNECRKAVPDSGAYHIALSETLDDYYHAKHCRGTTPVGMLLSHGLLGKNTLLAHCSHLRADEAEVIAEAGAAAVFVPHAETPESGRHSAVSELIRREAAVGLGTDGVSGDMLEALKTAVLLRRSGVDAKAAADMLLKGNAQIASGLFGLELGVLKPGAAADIIVMDYIPYTDMTPANLHLHMLGGMSGGQCRLTMVNGRLLMRDGRLIGVSREHTYERTRKTARLLWERLKGDSE